VRLRFRRDRERCSGGHWWKWIRGIGLSTRLILRLAASRQSLERWGMGLLLRIETLKLDERVVDGTYKIGEGRQDKI
jgi:hypothetical protein